jgi:hypothetical protein
MTKVYVGFRNIEFKRKYKKFQKAEILFRMEEHQNNNLTHSRKIEIIFTKN